MSGYWDELQEEKVNNIRIESELVAAKAEIELLEERHAKDGEACEILSFRIKEMHVENERLRDHIQRNEVDSVEIERLRSALKKIRDYKHEFGCNENRWDYCECPKKICDSALDGKGGEA